MTVTDHNQFIDSVHSFSMDFIYCLCRSARTVDQGHSDKLIADHVVLRSILDLFSGFHQFYQPEQKICLETAYKALASRDPAKIARLNSQATGALLGFTVERGPSTLPQGGTGVFVTSGCVPKGSVVAFYPGTIMKHSS